jgi:rod shape-determining protein MreB
MSKNYIGIDLGSSNIIIYVPSKGIVFNEPNVVALDNTQERNEKKVKAIGYMALKMVGKEDANTEVIRPVRNGYVESVTGLTFLLEHIFKAQKISVKKTTLVVSMPSEVSEVDIMAIKKVAKNIGFESFETKPESFLAGLSSSLTAGASRGNMVITLGGGCSDISVLSGDKQLLYKTSSFSGRKIDEAIARHIRKTHHLIIGEKTAEYIKLKIGSLEPFPENRLLEVTGKDIVTSLPHSVIVSTTEITQVITPLVAPLIDNISDCLELTPPEIASDIIEGGIVITGGLAILAGMRDYLESSLNVAVRIATDPTYSVINGIKYLIHELREKNK